MAAPDQLSERSSEVVCSRHQPRGVPSGLAARGRSTNPSRAGHLHTAVPGRSSPAVLRPRSGNPGWERRGAGEPRFLAASNDRPAHVDRHRGTRSRRAERRRVPSGYVRVPHPVVASSLLAKPRGLIPALPHPGKGRFFLPAARYNRTSLRSRDPPAQSAFEPGYAGPGFFLLLPSCFSWCKENRSTPHPTRRNHTPPPRPSGRFFSRGEAAVLRFCGFAQKHCLSLLHSDAKAQSSARRREAPTAQKSDCDPDADSDFKGPVTPPADTPTPWRVRM